MTGAPLKAATRPSDHREYCYDCFRPRSVCLCSLIQPFDTRSRIVILMHPREARREKNGTGRLSHRILNNSRLIVGVDFSDDEATNRLIADPEYKSVLLFPTHQAVNLSEDGYRRLLAPPEKLQIFVVDGTWSLASKILRVSETLQSLPTVSFTLRAPSGFRIKRQPRAECLSTIESIHLLLELAVEQGVEDSLPGLAQMPLVFERLVEIQWSCAQKGAASP